MCVKGMTEMNEWLGYFWTIIFLIELFLKKKKKKEEEEETRWAKKRKQSVFRLWTKNWKGKTKLKRIKRVFFFVCLFCYDFFFCFWLVCFHSHTFTLSHIHLHFFCLSIFIEVYKTKRKKKNATQNSAKKVHIYMERE